LVPLLVPDWSQTSREEIARELEGARQDRERADRRVAGAQARVVESGRQLEKGRKRERVARQAMGNAQVKLAARLEVADLALAGDRTPGGPGRRRAHGHEALKSLFVDEGFGELAAEETLETVVQAIEALQTHGRLVGIVTHLTALAERMPAQSKVRKAPEGSRMEMVR
jgi:exonuclease SbcC